MLCVVFSHKRFGSLLWHQKKLKKEYAIKEKIHIQQALCVLSHTVMGSYMNTCRKVQRPQQELAGNWAETRLQDVSVVLRLSPGQL